MPGVHMPVMAIDMPIVPIYTIRTLLRMPINAIRTPLRSQSPQINSRERLPSQQHSLHILHRQALKRHNRLHARAARMARQRHVPAVAQARAGARLVGVYVETGGADVAAFQGVGEGVLVDEGAAGDVDDAGAWA